jgi:hypothetical protein
MVWLLVRNELERMWKEYSARIVFLACRIWLVFLRRSLNHTDDQISPHSMEPVFHCYVYKSLPPVLIPSHNFTNFFLIHVCVFLPSMLSSSFMLPDQNFVCICYTCYMSHISYPPWFIHYSSRPVWWTAWLTIFLVMQFYPSSRYFLLSTLFLSNFHIWKFQVTWRRNKIYFFI